jgi:ATP-dependent DNA helicase DinG
MPADAVADALRRVVAQLPEGEARPGQVEMAVAVAAAIEAGEHLLVQAGTGTGKTLSYLVPAILGRRPTVVATATKALQEQLVGRDLPFLEEHLGVDFSYSLLKGRSNYLCRAALADVVGGGATQATLAGTGEDRGGVDRSLLGELVAWSAETTTGDRADLPFVVRDADWSKVSVAVTECPGRAKCSYGDVCFAEDARAAAAESDVVVVNTHLYGLHLATGGAILPEHDVVVVDEAHALEDVAADTLGLQLGPGRVENVARAVRALFTADHPAAAALDAAAARLHVAIEPIVGQRVDPNEGDLGPLLVSVAEAASNASAAARELDVGGDAGTRKERLLALAGHLAADVRFLQDAADGKVVWVEGGGVPSIRVAPVDVGGDLATRLFAVPTVVLTSATLSVGGSFEPVARRLGLDRAEAPHRSVDVGSPFDYEQQAVLYCAAHLPEPRATGYEAAMHAELESLIRAAGGRTLGLFTSRRAMAAAAEHLRAVDLPWRILVQDELPRPILQSEFLADETSILLATMGFWQGFDAPGPTCSLVAIDRLPFARPDDPLAEARRAAATRAKRSAFHDVDLPAAAVLLAQGVGRLVRGAGDRGVVAVLDKRLAKASYRWTLVSSLPPMRRTKDPDEVRRVLAEVTGTAVGQG